MRKRDRVIAVNDNLELHDVGDGKGYIKNTETGKKFSVQKIVSILAKGNWEFIGEK